MLKLQVATFLLVAVNLVSSADVTVRRAITSTETKRAIETGLEDCGSNGNLVSLSVGDCSATPCSLVSGQDVDVDITFTASADSDKVNFKVYSKLENNGVEYLAFNFDLTEEIIGGNSYILTYRLPVTDQYLGRLILRMQLTDVASERVEICTSAPADII